LTPQQKLKTARDKMFAVYSEACEKAGFESNDGIMRRHCSAVLSAAYGRSVEVVSRSRMSLEELQICAEEFKRGLPDTDVREGTVAEPWDGQGSLVDADPDPFEAE
jgi:hypothetical protein